MSKLKNTFYHPLFIYITLFLALTPKIQSEIISNPSRNDGFGAQYQTIIYSVIYAELNNKEFRYTPFRKMEHNYNNDADFLKKKEDLINFMDNFELCNDSSKQINVGHVIRFFESNLKACLSSESLKKIKFIFRENKNREDYFSNTNLNIAIHLRRPNPHDNRILGADTPDDFYLKTIAFLRNIYASKSPLFHIYSQGNIKTFEKIYCDDDIILHINESIEDTFTSMVLADVLVTVASSFSYTAGILSDGEIYYLPFWHVPLPHWKRLKF